MISNSKGLRIFFNVFLILLVLACIIPFWLLIVSSFTSEAYLVQHGYSLLPRDFSTAAYDYLKNASSSIGRAYMMSIIIAAIGVTCNVAMTVLFAYPLSRKELPGRKFFSMMLFFTMLFNGGMVPTYLVYTNLINIKDTIWGMIIPYLMFNAFMVIVTRTYFTSNVPNEVIEAAKIDGAGETQCLVKIVVPTSKPIIATVALMGLIGYWNNWTNGIYFLTTRTDLYGIQNYLNDVMNKASFLATHIDPSVSIAAADVPTIAVRMAIAVIAVIPLLIAYPFFQKYFVKGITLGSVKG